MWDLINNIIRDYIGIFAISPLTPKSSADGLF